MHNQFFAKFYIFALFAIWWIPQVIVAAPMYSVSPLVIDTKVQARDIINKEITVTNTGSQPVTLYPSVNNISLTEGSTIEEFIPAVMSDRTQSLASWIEISRLGIDLKQGETKKIPVTIHMNPDPLPGTYHAFVGFGNGRNRDEAEAQVKNSQAPGTIITVTIENKKSEFLKLSKFFINRFITKADNQAAVYTFNNPGDETVIPTGEIILYDSKGKEVGSVPVNREGVSIPPGGEHVFTTSVPSQGLFGKYKAFLSVEYGSTQRASMQDTSYFYALPLKAIISILVALALIVGLSAWHVHRKYLDDSIDDGDRLTFHIKESHSESKDHDVDLKKK